ncbi:MAG: hypothetical protein IAE99_10430 [Rhodothermales bacterium]|nr:hypothetical protein [Rhodothermales bacterium]MCA0269797.1 hypothetical protein [Bacteroidota bacterium]
MNLPEGLPRAAAELHGPVLRYAEAHTDAGRLRLTRLGTVTFPFDTRAALDAGHDEALSTLASALDDVFRGSTAETLAVVLHPPGLATWAVPVASDLDAEAQRVLLHREAALLADTPTDTLTLVTWPLYHASESQMWMQALALPKAWTTRLDRLRPGNAVPVLDLSPLAAARLLHNRPGAHLAVGCYDTHTELALIVDGQTRLVASAQATEPTDAAFAALRFVRQAGPDVPLPTPHLYGPLSNDAARVAFAMAFGDSATALDPLAPLGLNLPFDAATARLYAPLLGALVA